MKKSVKIAFIFAAMFSFTSCDKAKDRSADTPPPPPSDPGQGDNSSKMVVTEKKSTCKSVHVQTQIRDGKPLRIEYVNDNVSESKRSTADEGANSEIESSGKVIQIRYIFLKDGTKTKDGELRFSYKAKSKNKFEKRSATTFYEMIDKQRVATAEEGYLFQGNKKTLETNQIVESIFTEVDGGSLKETWRKVDGKEVEPSKAEYVFENHAEGEYNVSTEALKEPYTEDGVTTESDVTTCKYQITVK